MKISTQKSNIKSKIVHNIISNEGKSKIRRIKLNFLARQNRFAREIAIPGKVLTLFPPRYFGPNSH